MELVGSFGTYHCPDPGDLSTVFWGDDEIELLGVGNNVPHSSPSHVYEYLPEVRDLKDCFQVRDESQYVDELHWLYFSSSVGSFDIDKAGWRLKRKVGDGFSYPSAPVSRRAVTTAIVLEPDTAGHTVCSIIMKPTPASACVKR